MATTKQLWKQNNNRLYWEKREQKQRELYMMEEAQQQRELEKIYAEMYRHAEDEINRFYGKYADAEGIDITEAKKRVTQADIEAYEALAKEYVKNKDFSDRANAEMRLYNATMKINRLEMLKARIGVYMVAGINDIDDYYEKVITDRTRQEIERQAGILGETVSVADTTKRAENIVNASFFNATYSERIWSHQDRLKSMISIELQRGLIAGVGSREMAQRVKREFDVSASDAHRLMVTELRRVQTDVAMDSYKASGVQKYVYMAVNPRACPICREIDGNVYNVADAEPAKNAPPMHPNCVLPDTKIIAPALEAIMKSYYLGEVIEFTLSDGRRLTVSPNHIMLTPRGWVRAQDITKSDYVISYRRGVEPFLEGNPTDNDGVPSIEQVFTALAESQGVSTTCVPSTAEDLKGDVVADTEIEIIPTDSKLWDKLDTTKREMLRNVGFVGTGKCAEVALDSLGSFAKCLLTLGLASDRIMRRLSIEPLFFWRSLTCSQLVGFRTPSDYNARLTETAVNSTSANTETNGKRIGTFARFVKLCNQIRIKVLSGIRRNTKRDAVFDKHTLDSFGFVSDDFRNLTQTFAREIQIDDVVNIRRFNYSGHVYDTSCMVTLYTANGVITSNCHCTTAPYVDESEYNMWLEWLNQGGTTEQWNKMTPTQQRNWYRKHFK